MRSFFCLCVLAFASLVSGARGSDLPSSGSLNVTTADIISSTPVSRAFFNALSLAAGFIGLPAIVLSVLLSPRVQRDAVFVNFCITWMILAVSLCLLFFAGEQGDAAPELHLCFVQASLVDGALAMTPVSTLALVLQLVLRVRDTDTGRTTSQKLRWIQTTILLLLPYLVFLIFGIRDFAYILVYEVAPNGAAATFDVMNPAYFCKITQRAPLVPLRSTEVPLVGFIIAVKGLTLFIECGFGYWLFRRFRLVRGAGSRARPPVSALVRLVLFTLYRIAIVVVGIMVVENPNVFPIAEFFQATVPFAVFLIFGTSRDVLGAWSDGIRFVLRRPRRPNYYSDGGISSTNLTTTGESSATLSPVAPPSSARSMFQVPSTANSFSSTAPMVVPIERGLDGRFVPRTPSSVRSVPRLVIPAPPPPLARSATASSVYTVASPNSMYTYPTRTPARTSRWDGEMSAYSLPARH